MTSLINTPVSVADDLDAFRDALRHWLPGAIPANWRDRIRKGGEPAYLDVQREWYKALADAGLATAHWPSAWGGADLSLDAQIIFYSELARAGAPMALLYTVSLYHMPATMFAYGTPEQRDRYLEGVRNGGVVWCQGFSEPGAGSDLASLKTRAERRGDTYVVNGQKIWSSSGQHAEFCLLLARTDPTAKRKQEGISYFICDLRSPGVTVRPIAQPTAESEFNEIFFDDVEIPAENLIGEEGQGWQIAQTTLTTERGLLIFECVERLAQAYRKDADDGRDTWLRDPVARHQFVTFYPRIRAIQALVAQLLAELREDPHGGNVTATYVKLYWGPLLQDYVQFTTRAQGLEGQRFTEPQRCAGHNSGDAFSDFLWSYGWTIAGGSNEVMRNLVSERFLGLPKG
ncbi:acyl-CoA dehydrogenase family protein [Sphingobium sp. HBC34]|uniref:Acyl-CoA dehydrogenase family protein n=1 Tax=Sphingobium cyanobacteriorum TaxID=3063954 RepID=A0ABT8ZQ98_9SPHN|nr:acyl-CoA dehydrogenase family protein [Sphingobium sp. HBC34]MDO7836714.1 acyl-CoA dehydrogenase family protein [Sphingobium sp. HBC34]